MGNKEEGFRTDHLQSKCCQEPIRFQPTSEGFSLEAWCSKCGDYSFIGRVESLISFWMGDKESVIKNKGYIPSWLKKEKMEFDEAKSIIIEFAKKKIKEIKTLEYNPYPEGEEEMESLIEILKHTH